VSVLRPTAIAFASGNCILLAPCARYAHVREVAPYPHTANETRVIQLVSRGYRGLRGTCAAQSANQRALA